MHGSSGAWYLPPVLRGRALLRRRLRRYGLDEGDGHAAKFPQRRQPAAFRSRHLRGNRTILRARGWTTPITLASRPVSSTGGLVSQDHIPPGYRLRHHRRQPAGQ